MINRRICRKFWQGSWLGIDFNTLKIRPNYKQLADAEFYNEFYKTLFNTCKNYSDLPKYWLEEKQETADFISQYIKQNSAVLSYGSGIGYIEKCLTKLRTDLNISIFDFSNIAAKWIIETTPEINLVTDTKKLMQYDVITMIQLFSALSTDECISLLNSVQDKLKPNAIIIISHHPSYEFSLNINKSLKENFKNILNLIRPLIYYIKVFINKNSLQLWGWQRNSKELEFIIKQSCYKSFVKIYYANQEFFILRSGKC